MKNLYIGIDPSLNSTGLSFLLYDDDIKLRHYFVIIKPDANKLTKKEQSAQDSLLEFDYIFYHKEAFDDKVNHTSEYIKTTNLFNLLDKLTYIIKEESKSVDNIIVVQEGISYGSSLRTKSIFDLAGLNYLIRYSIYRLAKNFDNFRMYICPPTEIKKFASGSGNCKKDVMINLFSLIFPEIKKTLPKVDDIADAYFMSMYAKKLYEDEENEA